MNIGFPNTWKVTSMTPKTFKKKKEEDFFSMISLLLSYISCGDGVLFARFPGFVGSFIVMGLFPCSRSVMQIPQILSSR